MIFMVLMLLVRPETAKAHDAYFLRMLIDDHNYTYAGLVVFDKASLMSNEDKHMEVTIGQFAGLPENTSIPIDPEEYEELNKDREKFPMLYSFQPQSIDTLFGKAQNNASGEDADAINRIVDYVIPSLNDALLVVNDGVPFDSPHELMGAGKALVEAASSQSSVGGYKVTKGVGNADINKLRIPEGFDKDDYITLSKDGHQFHYIYRALKGYSHIDRFNHDTDYLTWNQLVYQAHHSYAMYGHTLRGAGDLNGASTLERMIVELLESLLTGLRSALGLYSLSDLVFNTGVRGSERWFHGIMALDWMSNVLGYHWVFQAIAWSLILFAIVKAIIQRNASTVNPMMRVSLIEDIQNLLITAVLLGVSIPVITMFSVLNVRIVDLFRALTPGHAHISGANNYSGLLSGVLLQFFYLFITIYMNFTYIMRAIVLALLISSAPLFICTIGFGGKWKGLFNTWCKELLGNIFLQSFHAFTISLFLTLSSSSRGIESAVIGFALIPLTTFFKGLIVQDSGVAGMMGSKAMGTGVAMAGAGLATGLASGGFVVGGIAGKLRGGSGAKPSAGVGVASGVSGSAGGFGNSAGKSAKLTGPGGGGGGSAKPSVGAIGGSSSGSSSGIPMRDSSRLTGGSSGGSSSSRSTVGATSSSARGATSGATGATSGGSPNVGGRTSVDNLFKPRSVSGGAKVPVGASVAGSNAGGTSGSVHSNPTASYISPEMSKVEENSNAINPSVPPEIDMTGGGDSGDSGEGIGWAIYDKAKNVAPVVGGVAMGLGRSGQNIAMGGDADYSSSKKSPNKNNPNQGKKAVNNQIHNDKKIKDKRKKEVEERNKFDENNSPDYGDMF